MTFSWTDPRPPDRFLVAAGAILLGLFALPPLIPNYPQHVTALITVYGTASAVWLCAVWRVAHADDVGPSALRIVVVFALLFRAVVLPQASILDDDLYRYVWDGRMTWNGVNPYRYAPADHALADSRDALIYPHINFPHVPTIYPPLTQIAFAGVVGFLGESLVAMKLVWTIVDGLVVIATIGLLRAAGVSEAMVIVYAWAPLTIKEIAGSGHMDALPALLTVLAVVWVGRRPAFGACALGAAVAAKLYPILLIPLFLRRWGVRALAIPCVVLLAFAPFVSVPVSRMFQGLRIYGEYWMFNPGLFDLLQRGMSLFTAHNLFAAKLLAGTAVIVVIFRRMRRRHETVHELSESALWILSCTLLVAPTADPWYLLWFLPFLCVHPNPGLLAWCGLSALSYGFYYDHADVAWLRLVEYAPVFLLLLWPVMSRGLSGTLHRSLAKPNATSTPAR